MAFGDILMTASSNMIVDEVKKVSKEIAKLQAKNQQLFRVYGGGKPRPPEPPVRCRSKKSRLLRSVQPSAQSIDDATSMQVLFLNNASIYSVSERDNHRKPNEDSVETYYSKFKSSMEPEAAWLSDENPSSAAAGASPRTAHVISELLKQQFMELDPSTCSIQVSDKKPPKGGERRVRRTQVNSLVKKAMEMTKRCEMFKDELNEEVSRGINRESPQVTALLRNYSKLEHQIAELKEELCCFAH